jgi:3-hydroxyisobutyrate dehydrogenase-like beta-hydroxyacid dehydrogenase
VDLGWRDLGLGVELAAAAGAKTAVGREAWKLYKLAREAGLGRVDTSGLLGLLEPKPWSGYLPSLISRCRRWR